MKYWHRSLHAGAALWIGFAPACLADSETDDANGSSPEISAAEQALLCIPDIPAPGCSTPEPCQPPPPACGPGSLIYAHTATNTLNYVYKDENGLFPGGELQYNLYEPSSPQPASAPLIVFLPGYSGGADPSGGLALFTHLARKGYIVLFVNYGGVWPDFAAYESNANEGIAHAIAELQRPGSGHVTPDLSKVAFVGHSLGGMLITRLAANPGPGVPSPRVIVPADPANDILYAIGTDHLQDIPASTYVFTILAASSNAPEGGEYATDIYLGTTAIPSTQKNLLHVRTDAHGEPDMVSDHFTVIGSPSNPFFPLNAADYWFYWRPIEGAIAAAFGLDTQGYQPYCNAPFPACPSVRVAGRWSDNHPVSALDTAGDLGL